MLGDARCGDGVADEDSCDPDHCKLDGCHLSVALQMAAWQLAALKMDVVHIAVIQGDQMMDISTYGHVMEYLVYERKDMKGQAKASGYSPMVEDVRILHRIIDLCSEIMYMRSLGNGGSSTILEIYSPPILLRILVTTQNPIFTMIIITSTFACHLQLKNVSVKYKSVRKQCLKN